MNRLSGELNQSITQEMNDLINSVSSQIQKSISEGINEQVLPQIQANLKSRQEQVPRKGWIVPAERPEIEELKKPLIASSEAALKMSFPEASLEMRMRKILNTHVFEDQKFGY